MDFSARLNVVLDELGLQVPEVAERMGVDPVVVYRYCSGARRPNLEAIRALSLALGISSDSLLGLGEQEDEEIMRLVLAFSRVRPERRWAVIRFADFIAEADRNDARA